MAQLLLIKSGKYDDEKRVGGCRLDAHQELRVAVVGPYKGWRPK
jgi:hypothetical protein